MDDLGPTPPPEDPSIDLSRLGEYHCASKGTEVSTGYCDYTNLPFTLHANGTYEHDDKWAAYTVDAGVIEMDGYFSTFGPTPFTYDGAGVPTLRFSYEEAGWEPYFVYKLGS